MNKHQNQGGGFMGQAPIVCGRGISVTCWDWEAICSVTVFGVGADTGSAIGCLFSMKNSENNLEVNYFSSQTETGQH